MHIPYRKFWRIGLLVATLLVAPGLIDARGVQAQSDPPATVAANPDRPLGLPFATAPGPSTWYVGQQYGNTSGAFNFGKYWYGAGQGLHFGIDFSARCQTPIIAVADGVIDFADNFSHGSLPHNLAIVHRDLGLISFYGHLYRRPTVQRGQPVKKGDVVALSGDPDSTCISRPHLHLEIRSLNYRDAYNPAALINADWATLSSIGYQGRYVKDLYHPNRWQTPDDQPNVRFGDRIVNLYESAWPPKQRYAPSIQTAAEFSAPPLRDGDPIFKRLTAPGCCSMAWWAPDSQTVRLFNGEDGQFAKTETVDIERLGMVPIDGLTPASTAINGKYTMGWLNDSTLRNERVEVRRAFDNRVFQVATGGTWPTFSPSATRLLWQRFPSDPVPGNSPPLTEVWVSSIETDDRRIITIQPGGSVHWLDDDRILLSAREGITLYSRLSIYDLRDKSITPLFRAENVRGLSVAPGGKQIMFYLTFQKDSNADGMYLLETLKDAIPAKLPFFGSWRWRDSTHVLYIPYQLGESMRLIEYDTASGQSRPITEPKKQPFRILNDDWSISPDGAKVLYWDEIDHALWLITLPL